MNNEIKKIIGLKIRSIRIKRGLTVVELSNKTNSARSTISNIENGIDIMSLNVLYELCEALKVDILNIIPSSDFYLKQINN